jgi:hypothetical protein
MSVVAIWKSKGWAANLLPNSNSVFLRFKALFGSVINIGVIMHI